VTTKAQRLAAREMALVEELQRDHGWSFRDIKQRGDRTAIAFTRVTDRRGRTTQTLAMVRNVIASFPTTSPVAVATAKSRKTRRKP